MASSAGAGAGGRPKSGRELKMTIEEVAKKLTLWHNATLRPILTHAELEPILGAAGFVPLPPGETQSEQGRPPAMVWREYVFLGRNARWPGPRPRLPYPRVDGLHLKTYEAFLGAVEACLGSHRVANLFHVRLMPVTNPGRALDKQFRPMRNFTLEEDGLIVYREGTLDEATLEACSRHTAAEDVGHHVFPGVTCRDVGHLRKLDCTTCHEESCAGLGGGGGCGAAGNNKYPALRDICPEFFG